MTYPFGSKSILLFVLAAAVGAASPGYAGTWDYSGDYDSQRSSARHCGNRCISDSVRTDAGYVVGTMIGDVGKFRQYALLQRTFSASARRCAGYGESQARTHRLYGIVPALT